MEGIKVTKYDIGENVEIHVIETPNHVTVKVYDADAAMYGPESKLFTHAKFSAEAAKTKAFAYAESEVAKAY